MNEGTVYDRENKKSEQGLRFATTQSPLALFLCGIVSTNDTTMLSKFLLPGFVILITGTVLWYNETARICPVPLSYHIGSVDERFGISKDTVVAVANEAELLWETTSGRELFRMTEGEGLPINFVYDERQQKVATEEEWRQLLDAAEAKNNQGIADLKQMTERYEALRDETVAAQEHYETRQSTYNAEVARANAAGGASPSEFERLTKEAATLTKEAEVLSKKEETLQSLVATINATGEALNASIAAYNAEVSEYNERFGTRETFTQGEYQVDRINVYKFSTKEELLQVLAHELGHALGIPHVEEEGAIMYYLMTERETTALSEADKAAFEGVCGRDERFSHKLRHHIRTTLHSI